MTVMPAAPPSVPAKVKSAAAVLSATAISRGPPVRITDPGRLAPVAPVPVWLTYRLPASVRTPAPCVTVEAEDVPVWSENGPKASLFPLRSNVLLNRTLTAEVSAI